MHTPRASGPDPVRGGVWRAAALAIGLAAAACAVLDPGAPGNLVPPTVDDDPDLPAVDLSATRLHVQTFGDPTNPPLFVLEGGPGGDFRYMLGLLDPVDGRRLTDDWFVVFHDYRGSGLSRRHAIEDLSLDTLRSDLDELIDHVAPDRPVVLLGHSHGGLLAVQCIDHDPERIRGAVLIEPGELSGAILAKQPDLVPIDYFGQGVHDVTWVRQLITADDHETADYYVTIARESLEQSQRGDDPAQRKPSWRRGAASLLAIPLGEMAEHRYDYTRNLAAFDREVLFVSSELSEDLGFDFQARAQVPLFPRVRHVMVEGTGHSGIIEARVDETLRHVFAYLDALEAP